MRLLHKTGKTQAATDQKNPAKIDHARIGGKPSQIGDRPAPDSGQRVAVTNPPSGDPRGPTPNNPRMGSEAL